MPYRKATVWDFDLKEIDAPEFSVTCTNPGDLPAGELVRVQQAQAILNRAQRKNELADEDTWALTAIDEFLRKTIVGWTLTHPDSNEPLPLAFDRAAYLAKLLREAPPAPDADPDEIARVQAEAEKQADAAAAAFSPFTPLPTYVYQFIVQQVMAGVAGRSKRS